MHTVYSLCMKPLKHFCALATFLASAQPFAQSPAGLWQTTDDVSKKPKAHVRLVEEAGVVRGFVVVGLDPNDKPDAVCALCTDERKDKPIVGMTIVRNLRKNPAGDAWTGGDVLDPNNGKVYRAQVTLSADNKTLTLRGYIGTPLLGRNQTWQRIE
jgi:uncharacterized protein (DUF2147 family)